VVGATIARCGCGRSFPLGAAPFSGRNLYLTCLGHGTGRTTSPLTLPVTLQIAQLTSDRLKMPRTLSTPGAPTAEAFQARSDFHRWIPSASPFAGAEGETEGPPLLPWLCRLGPASDHAFARAEAG